MAGRNKMTGSNNLLENNSGQENMIHWKVLKNGGDGFAVEDPPVGCKPLEEVCKSNVSGWPPQQGYQKIVRNFLCCTRLDRQSQGGCGGIQGPNCCWATSYNLCMKSQLIDLMEAGLSDDKLAKDTPLIKIRDWYGARVDCGCHYRICVRLLGSDKKELDKWDFQDTLEAGATWTQVKHVFNYPVGVRFVEFRHGGKDTKFWAGHYGVKLARSGVYILNGQNLIKNPCAKDKLEGWTTLSSGGDGIICEVPPVGCKLPPANFGANVGCWATSFELGQTRQVVDLAAAGLEGCFMDKTRPEIKISDWYGVRRDAGCKYSLQVRLLNAAKGEVDKFEFEVEKKASGDWFQASHSFQGYGEGVRFVEFTHGGTDTCFWAGHYGVKLTGSSVIVCSATADKP